VAYPRFAGSHVTAHIAAKTRYYSVSQPTPQMRDGWHYVPVTNLTDGAGSHSVTRQQTSQLPPLRPTRSQKSLLGHQHESGFSPSATSLQPATVTPFLRWAGSKRWLIATLREIAPKEFGAYYEPFLGSGAIFFNIAQGHESFLSDTIPTLLNCYEQVRDRPGPLTRLAHSWTVSSDDYYRIRALDFGVTGLESAAQFIYLNKLCFNGLYRENRLGQFNVPFGKPRTDTIIDFKQLLSASEHLRTDVHLLVSDFESALDNCAPKDFVYLDPPYAYNSKTRPFADYNSRVFDWQDQKRLARIFARLNNRGVYVAQTNVNDPAVSDLYTNFTTIPLDRYSSMSGSAAGRGSSRELLILSDALATEVNS
jgi:DNA adenine methylase